MCGRLNVSDNPYVQALMKDFGMPIFPEFEPRWNIAPGTSINIVTRKQTTSVRWGINFKGFSHPNSRASTIRNRSDLQDCLARYKCLVPVNGFYEWPDTKRFPQWRGRDTRFHISTPQGAMFLAAFAKPTDTGWQANIITTDPTAEIAEFHHRSPVILNPTQAKEWLQHTDSRALMGMCQPYAGELKLYECSSFVDDARHVGAQCAAPAGDYADQISLI
jgi:putative SOS response-associated peptidase YedK